MEDSTKPAVPPAMRCCIGFFFLGVVAVVVDSLLLFVVVDFASLELIFFL